VTGIDYDAGSTTRERSLRVERSSAVRYTYQDLLSLPEGASRHEILDGALHVTAAPRVNHQRVALGWKGSSRACEAVAPAGLFLTII
jgi:hypothetical protein